MDILSCNQSRNDGRNKLSTKFLLSCISQLQQQQQQRSRNRSGDSGIAETKDLVKIKKHADGFAEVKVCDVLLCCIVFLSC